MDYQTAKIEINEPILEQIDAFAIQQNANSTALDRQYHLANSMTMRSWEYGQTMPSVKTVIHLASVMHCGLDTLLGFQGPNRKVNPKTVLKNLAQHLIAYRYQNQLTQRVFAGMSHSNECTVQRCEHQMRFPNLLVFLLWCQLMQQAPSEVLTERNDKK